MDVHFSQLTIGVHLLKHPKFLSEARMFQCPGQGFPNTRLPSVLICRGSPEVKNAGSNVVGTPQPYVMRRPLI